MNMGLYLSFNPFRLNYYLFLDMSNRNFDNRVIIQRLQNQVYARNLYTNNTSGQKLINNPQNTDGTALRYESYISGAQTEYFRGLVGKGETVSIGGIVNISPYVTIPPPSIIAPSAPTITSIGSGNQELSVNFTAPLSNGGADITDYEYSTNNGSNWISAGSTISPLAISSLSIGTTYDVKIRAVNSAGAGAESNMIQGTTWNVPSAPTITSITIGNEELIVNFTAPLSDGGSAITDYDYSLNEESFSAGQTTSPITITGLTNGQSYEVRIIAVNAVGTGELSNMVLATPATTPSAPTITSITPGNQQLTVNFTVPTSDGGSTITNYEYSTNGGTSFTPFSPEDTTSPVIITGLTNGTSYSVRIRAVNSINPGAQSNAVSATPAGVPNPPTSLTGVAGNQAIYVLFTEGNNGGSPITNYEYSIDGGSSFTPFSPAQTISPVEISNVGLTNGTSYTVQLKAVNVSGSSIASSSVSVTPTITTLLSTNMLIELDSNNSSSYSGSGTAWTNLKSSGSYSATLNGSPTYNTSNPSNKYFEFNTEATTGQFAQINQAAAINPVLNTPFTIQMWVKINNIGSQGSLVSKVFGSPSFDGYALGYRVDNSLELHENGLAQVYYFSSPTNVIINGWALYTANIQFGNGGGRTNKIFVNGRQVVNRTSNDTGIPAPTQNITFPTGFYGEGECDIGAFYYYNTELTVEQIIQNYDATKTRYGL